MPDDNGIFMEFAQALEPPKRGPGRPAGSRNKKTLEMEAKMAKKAGQKLADEAKKKKGKKEKSKPVVAAGEYDFAGVHLTNKIDVNTWETNMS